MSNARTVGPAVGLPFLLLACASYEQKHVEFGAPELYANSVAVNDITLAADPYESESEVVAVFDENLLEKGYHPIKLLVKNGSQNRIMIFRESVELRDAQGYSYHPVSASVMADDFEDNKMAYALLGFGIFSYMSADEANKDRAADYQAKALADTQIIPAGGSRGAFVYFQLPQGADLSASRLSLEVEHLGTKEITRLEVPLGGRYAGTGAVTSVAAATTTPAALEEPQPPPFDGVWILEVSNSAGAKDKDRVRTVITNGRFSASFSTNGWQGKLSGEINEFGTLFANGAASKMAWGAKNVPLELSTQYRSDSFTGVMVGKGRVKPRFRVVLFRNAAGG